MGGARGGKHRRADKSRRRVDRVALVLAAQCRFVAFRVLSRRVALILYPPAKVHTRNQDAVSDHPTRRLLPDDCDQTVATFRIAPEA